DLDAKLDFTQDPVETGVARAILKGGGGRAEPGQGRRRERSAQEPDLELVERIEGNPAALDRAAPAFGRVFHALQSNKCIDAADRSQGGSPPGRPALSLLAHRKVARPGAARGIWGGGRGGADRSLDAHRSNPSARVVGRCPDAVQTRALWLMVGKQPGKK